MPQSLSNVLPILVQAHPDGEQRKSAQGLTARQLGALERVPARIEDALEHMDAIIEMLAAEGGEAGARRKRASSILRCLDDAIARLPRAAELDRTRLIVERNHDFIFHGSPVLMAHVLARVIEAALNENPSRDRRAADGDLWAKQAAGTMFASQNSSTELRGAAARLLSRLARNDREFSNRPDLALANLVLGRMGGSVTRTLVFGRSEETVLWLAQPGA